MHYALHQPVWPGISMKTIEIWWKFANVKKSKVQKWASCALCKHCALSWARNLMKLPGPNPIPSLVFNFVYRLRGSRVCKVQKQAQSAQVLAENTGKYTAHKQVQSAEASTGFRKKYKTHKQQHSLKVFALCTHKWILKVHRQVHSAQAIAYSTCNCIAHKQLHSAQVNAYCTCKCIVRRRLQIAGVNE